jgi:hypothetical protein
MREKLGWAGWGVQIVRKAGGSTLPLNRLAFFFDDVDDDAMMMHHDAYDFYIRQNCKRFRSRSLLFGASLLTT